MLPCPQVAGGVKWETAGMAREIPKIDVGNVVQLRKAHPCGDDVWLVTRVGADIGLQCRTCGRRVMLDRLVFERRLRRVLETASGDT